MWWYLQSAIPAESRRASSRARADWWIRYLLFNGPSEGQVLVHLPNLVVIQRAHTTGLWVWWKEN